MIEKVGLLPSGNHQQVPFAYRMYMQDDEEGELVFSEIREAHIEDLQDGSNLTYS